MTDILQNSTRSGPFGFYNDRFSDFVEWDGIRSLTPNEIKTVDDVRKGRQNVAIIKNGTSIFVFEYAPTGNCDEYTDHKKWGYVVYSADVLNIIEYDKKNTACSTNRANKKDAIVAICAAFASVALHVTVLLVGSKK